MVTWTNVLSHFMTYSIFMIYSIKLSYLAVAVIFIFDCYEILNLMRCLLGHTCWKSPNFRIKTNYVDFDSYRIFYFVKHEKCNNHSVIVIFFHIRLWTTKRVQVKRKSVGEILFFHLDRKRVFNYLIGTSNSAQDTAR